MKKIFLLLTLVASVSARAQIEKVIPPKPNPPRLVNDYTGTLTPEQAESLENKLVRYDDSTSNQVVVTIIPTLKDYPIEDVSLGILRQWGVGNKEKNNGIVLLVAKEDHQVRIEVGYGLEGAVPDITANQIIQSDIVPNFRQENYYRGLDLATSDIIKAAAGEYKAPAGYSERGQKKGISPGIIFLIIVLVWVLMNISSRGGGGGMLSRRGYRGWLGPVWPGGGWIGGGGGGGWSGGGGGFGGFGGGSGGGGGSSGSW
ncbi:MAG TPA: TPM domain-containing protein [Chitinophagaceae bacterium]|nr:TPM domain-containing protein [Chitinophagaceae bacterium]